MRWLTALGLLAAASIATADEPTLAPYSFDHDAVGETLVDNSHFLQAPAGGEGFIRVDGEHFVKPDGSRFRIWGVNITGPAAFPDPEDAVRIADDLARMGVNCVRFHGLDSNWGRSSIDYSRDDTQSLNEADLDRFDRLVFELKKRGIYTNLNLNVFRKFKEGDGVRDADHLWFGKSATYFNPRLLELQRDYARKLLTHKNAYTGNEYRHEPAVFCIEMVNENSVLEGWVGWRLVGEDVEKPSTWSPIPVSYAQELTDLYNAWLAENVDAETLTKFRVEAGVADGAPIPRLRPDQFEKASKERFHAEARFYFGLEENYFQTMKSLIREELGAEPLLCGTSDHNDSKCLYAHVKANLVMDFVDGHGYWQHPSFGEHVKIKNTPMVNDPWDSTVTQFARSPVVGRPYTISETNHPFPHKYAGEGIPILTAYALFHDWDGVYWYTYEAGPRLNPAEGIRSCFDMSRDPMKMAEVAACAPMWHRQDVQPANQRIVRHYTPEQHIERLRMNSSERPFFMPDFPRSTPLRHATRWTYDGDPSDNAFPEDCSRDSIVSDTGELEWINAGKGRGVVSLNNDRAVMLAGHVRDFAPSLGDRAPKIENEFCTLLATSLDGKPLPEAERVVLVTAGTLTNTNIAWAEDGETMLEWGGGPTLTEPVVGTVTISHLENGARKLRVTPLTPTGKALGDPILVEDDGNGWFQIPLGDPATVWMLIEVVR